MTQVLTGPTALIPRWLATDDRAQAAWSLAAEIVTSGRKRSGNRATDVGVGVTSGRALATIKDAPTWGGLDYLACDAFPARLDTSTGEIIAVEGYDDADTPGLAPWMLKGEKRNIRRAKGIEGFVARGNQIGDNYARAHVWIRNGELVAHHRKTADSADPPLNSTPVHDPGEGSDDWEAGLHGIMRVRAFPEEFCGGNTAVPREDKFRALLLNFTKSTGDNSGRGAATFSDREGLLSYEGFGPLTFGAPKHRVGEADGRETRQGAIDCDRALFGDRSDAFTAPLLFEKTAWKQGGGRFITAAHIRMDAADTHQGYCGVKKGKWKPESRCHWNYLPPTHPKLPPPTDGPPIDGPPPRRPEDPGEPGRPVIDPGPIPGVPPPTFYDPANSGEDSGVSTPDEIQIPSEYGHAKPNIPEADEQRQGVEGDASDPEGMLPTHGYTYEQALRSNVVSHEGFIPQYVSASEVVGAGSDPNARYPQKTSRIAEITKDDSGRIVAYKRGYGPGTKVKLPGNAKVWHALYALKERWPSSFDEHNFIVVAGKNAAGVEMVGTLGIGLRAMATVKPAAGWYFKLDYTDGHDVPDLDIRSTDSAGLDASTGRVVKINGTDITTTVSNAVTAASAFTAANRVLVADGADRSADDSDFTMSQNGTNAVDVASGTTFNIGGNVATSIILRTDTSVSGTIASGHTTVTATEDAAAINAGVDATDGPYEKTYWGDHSTAGTGTAETIIAIRKPAADACISLYVEIEAIQSADASNTHVSTHVVSYYDKAGTLTYDAVVTSATGGTLPQTIAFDASGDDMRVRITDDSNVYRVGVKCRVKWRTTSA